MVPRDSNRGMPCTATSGDRRGCREMRYRCIPLPATNQHRNAAEKGRNERRKKEGAREPTSKKEPHGQAGSMIRVRYTIRVLADAVFSFSQRAENKQKKRFPGLFERIVSFYHQLPGTNGTTAVYNYDHLAYHPTLLCGMSFHVDPSKHP